MAFSLLKINISCIIFIPTADLKNKYYATLVMYLIKLLSLRKVVNFQLSRPALRGLYSKGRKGHEVYLKALYLRTCAFHE